jgi:hypothetical protein
MSFSFVATLKKAGAGFEHVISVVESDVPKVETKIENVIITLENDLPGLNTIVSKYLEPAGAALLTAAENDATSIAKSLGSGATIDSIVSALGTDAENLKGQVLSEFESLIKAAGGSGSLVTALINFAWVSIEGKFSSIATAAVAAAA